MYLGQVQPGETSGQTKTCWRFCISHVAWEGLRIPQWELEDTAGEKDMRMSGLLACCCYPDLDKQQKMKRLEIILLVQRMQSGPTLWVKGLRHGNILLQITVICRKIMYSTWRSIYNGLQLQIPVEETFQANLRFSPEQVRKPYLFPQKPEDKFYFFKVSSSQLPSQITASSVFSLVRRLENKNEIRDHQPRTYVFR